MPFFAAVMVAIGASWLFGGINFGTRFIGAVVIALSLLGAAWLMFYVRLILSEDAVIIRNIRTQTIRYADIESVEPMYEGLVVKANGRRHVALAIQRWNISLFLRRRTRADRIADEVQRRATDARPDPSEDPSATP